MDVEARADERRRVQELVIVTLSASVLDVVVTFWALSHHWAVELNPIANHGMGSLGLNETIALNLVLRLVVVGGLGWIAAAAAHPSARRAAGLVLTGSAMWWTLVAVLNVVVLGVAVH